ncbi:2-oxoglutarate-dependent dioxygenase-related protein [Corchorus olitorius]|uniref:2-oxoglutarate-dependent dioxygenase-related protein n=1 Tax=Corchorus olitorius TaxID=93759 RepID=A0A1R3HG92_9ROSI|nr:2-oxoglutarate-dependent dioxygenase-related protein [Corchorus olitorius]
MVKLPVIDFSNQDLKPGTLEWDLVKAQVRQAIHEYGCFEASFDKIMEVRKPLIGAIKTLIFLSLERNINVVGDRDRREYSPLYYND